jgi:hypothetical protein
MPKFNDIRDRSDALREEIEAHYKRAADLEARLARYETLPKDEYDNGSVVVFEKKFTKSGITYTYAAVKGGGFWFLSGESNRRTWEGMLDFIYANIGDGGFVKAYWVSQIEEIG